MLLVVVAPSVPALPVLSAAARQRDLAGTSASAADTAAAGIMEVLGWLAVAGSLTGTAPFFFAILF